MAFTVKDFPGRLFDSIAEYEEAVKLRSAVEKKLEAKVQEQKQEAPVKVVAHIIPAEPETLERRVSTLEAKLDKIIQRLFRKRPDRKPQHNGEGIPVGMVLSGESKGSRYTLEVLPDRYLCSDGFIYQSLSGAALGVSGNRRSGWRFWHGEDGRSIGEVIGRFDSNDESLSFQAE